MKILIYGSSGATGQILIRQALLLGHEVTAFVRNPKKLKATRSHLRIVRGDIVNPSQVVEY